MKFSFLLILIVSWLLLVSENPCQGASGAGPQSASTVVPQNDQKQGDESEETPQKPTAKLKQKPEPSNSKRKPAEDGDKREGLELNRLLTLYTGQLADYTWLLVIVGSFQGLIAVFQIFLLCKTIRISRAALHVNRPFIVVEQISLEMADDIPKGIKVTFGNLGTGPADLINVLVDADLFDEPMPEPRLRDLRFTESSRYSPQRPVIRAEGEMTANFFSSPVFDRRKLAENGRNKKQFAIYGKVRYRGAPKEGYTTRFFWWLDKTSQFIPALSDELNARD